MNMYVREYGRSSCHLQHEAATRQKQQKYHFHKWKAIKKLRQTLLNTFPQHRNNRVSEFDSKFDKYTVLFMKWQEKSFKCLKSRSCSLVQYFSSVLSEAAGLFSHH